MNHSLILFTVVFLLLMMNLDCYQSESVTVALGVVSSLVTIGTFLWDLLDKITQKKPFYDTVRYSRDMESNSMLKFTNMMKKLKLEDNYIKVNALIFDIEKYHKDMKRYNESLESRAFDSSYDIMRLEAKANLSRDRHRPIGLMRSIHELVVAKDEYSIFNSLRQSFQGYPRIAETCLYENDMKRSQTYFLDYYLMLIAAVEAKVLMTVQMSSEILKTTSNADTYTYDVRILIEELNEMYHSIMKTYLKLLKPTSREILRCDPSSHVEDGTYTKLNNVFNLFIVNEKHLDDNKRCAGTCDASNPRHLDRPHDSEIATYSLDPLWDCKRDSAMHIPLELNICYSVADSTRRYNYVELATYGRKNHHYNNNFIIHYGPSKNCENGILKTESVVYSKQGWECDVCTCTRDNDNDYNKTDPRQTERFFYAKPIMVDVFYNYVLTGVRLVKKDGIVFFEVQQGKLSTLSAIEPSSISWKTVEKENLYNSSNLIKIHWRQRSIELQDIDVPHGHFLVGLQIDVISDRIVLKVLSLPIDFVNGRVKIMDHYSIADITSTTSLILSQTGLDLENLDLPDPKVKCNNIVTNKYLNFSTSSVRNDVGQTTIPFLDIQKVTTSIPMPMAGAGFYYKYSSKKYAGYLGIKLKTYDFTRHSRPYTI